MRKEFAVNYDGCHSVVEMEVAEQVKDISLQWLQVSLFTFIN